MIVLTGGAGFIGSCILAKLNERGRTDIVVVDHVESPDPKEENLRGKQYITYYDKKPFIDLVHRNRLSGEVDCVIHMGACSSTTLADRDYYERNNYEYTRDLALWCLGHEVRFIYASSAATYGDGRLGYDDADDAVTRRLEPLNLYGASKQKLDLWAMNKAVLDRMAGLKFFNVFGPNEYHKGDMRSVLCKAYPKAAREGTMVLFKSHRPDYADGEQKRDFIYVKDAVDIVMFFVDHPQANGLFNVGTGQARSWNDLAHALFSALDRPPKIVYTPMPDNIRDQYQYFTEARMDKLRACGYKKPFIPLEQAVHDYVQYLKEGRYL